MKYKKEKTMTKIFLKTSIVMSFLWIATLYSHATMAEAPPSLEKILNPSQPWGLNLDLVDKRQKLLRQKGEANDFSTKIMLYRGNKTLMAKKINERQALIKKSQDVEAEATAKIKTLNPLNLPGRTAVKKKKDQDLSIIQKQIEELDKSLALYKDVTSKLINNIMQETGLPPEKVAKIPGVEK